MSNETIEERTLSGAHEGDGKVSVNHQLTPKSKNDTVNIMLDPRPVIPILFIPGIMGSNLKNIKMDETVWSPPNNIFSGIAGLFLYMGKSASQRKEELNQAQTEVDYDGRVSNFPLKDDPSVQHDRKWGGIYKKVYHHFMGILQSRLNEIKLPRGIFTSDSTKPPYRTWWLKLMEYKEKNFGRTAGKSEGVQPFLSADELDHASNFRFEVWGGGYNWLQSNEKSADKLVEQIDEILAFYKNKEGKSHLAIDKVLIITHSMGGLVARSIAVKAKDKVLGVLHGAMPANGASETYVNMRRGVQGLLGTFIGRDTSEVGAIMAYAQGALELLPFGQGYNVQDGYNDKWLHFQKDGKTTYLPSNSDPYKEIYNSTEWYGLLPDTAIDTIPVGEEEEGEGQKKGAVVRKIFSDNIKEVKKFHESIIFKYHPETYAFWGIDPELESMSWVSWKESADQRPPKGEEYRQDTGKGRTHDGNRWRELLIGEEAGDGTVPISSWRLDLGKPKMVFLHGGENSNGFGHQEAFCNELAENIGMYFAVKMAKLIPKPK